MGGNTVVAVGDMVGGVFMVLKVGAMCRIAWLSSPGKVSHEETVTTLQLLALVKEFSS